MHSWPAAEFEQMTVTTEALLQFWSKAIPNLQVHPDDGSALNANNHSLALDTLIGPWMGPIRTAPVVLLTLNGGLAGNGEEARAAQLPAARAFTAHNLTGDAPLPDWHAIGNPAGLGWTTGRLSQFGLSYKQAADKVAFINLMPYKSKEGAKDMRMADRLPSARMMRAWARDSLFRQAETGERIVVCLRSAKTWGLPTPPTSRGTLFVPQFTRGGFMHHGKMREEIGRLVRRAVNGQAQDVLHSVAITDRPLLEIN
jgi:hypothetical protein